MIVSGPGEKRAEGICGESEPEMKTSIDSTAKEAGHEAVAKINGKTEDGFPADRGEPAHEAVAKVKGKAEDESLLEIGQRKVELIPSHFGDIMSVQETRVTLSDTFLPLERIVLVANGNLQRIISAYYNEAVTVEIIKNELIPGREAFDREVLLKCRDKVFCRATSEIKITKDSIMSLVVEQKVGIGQLFRYLHILPEFELLDAGKDAETLWRLYRLKADGVTCVIKEVFPANLFTLFD